MPRLVIIIILAALLTGCAKDQRILEDLAMSQSASYDADEGNKIKVGLSIPIAASDSRVQRMMLTTVANTGKEARITFARKTELKVVSGQLRNTLYGIELAKKGIEKHIDTLLRDPSIALRVKVTIVEGVASELLGKSHKQHADTGQYIERMIQKESAKNNIPRGTLHEFSRDINDDGIDPILPIVKDAGENVEIAGIALFQDNRYKMKIPAKKGVLFHLFMKSFNQGEISMNLGGSASNQEIVMLNSLLNKRKVKVHQLEGNRFKVDITASIRGTVLEYTGDYNLTKKKEREKLEKKISEYLVSEANRMIKEMQEQNVDSLGLGQYVRNSLSYAEWNKLNWRKVYPEIEIVCHAKVLIKSYGKYSG